MQEALPACWFGTSHGPVGVRACQGKGRRLNPEGNRNTPSLKCHQLGCDNPLVTSCECSRKHPPRIRGQKAWVPMSPARPAAEVGRACLAGRLKVGARPAEAGRVWLLGPRVQLPRPQGVGSSVGRGGRFGGPGRQVLTCRPQTNHQHHQHQHHHHPPAASAPAPAPAAVVK